MILLPSFIIKSIFYGMIKEETYIIKGMSCAACSGAVERVTGKIDGVISSSVNLATEKMHIRYDDEKVKFENIRCAVEKAGFSVEIFVRNRNKESSSEKNHLPLVAMWVLSLMLLYVSMLGMFFKDIYLPDVINPSVNPLNAALCQMVLSILIMFTGRYFFKNGFSSLIHKNPNMNTLVALGSVSSFLYSFFLTLFINEDNSLYHHLYYESSALVLTFVMTGKTIEKTNRNKAKKAVSSLLSMIPDTVNLIKDGSLNIAKAEKVPSDEAGINDVIVVKPFETVPFDGIILEGSTFINESLLTGESLVREKKKNDEVIAGTVNSNGLIIVKITKDKDDSTVSKIAMIMEDAQEKKAPLSRLADRISKVFVPFVIVFAFVSFFIWLFVSRDFYFSVKIFTSVLVIACPCAMGLATPMAILSGTLLASKNGIVFKSGEALENLNKADVFVFDKTGTITEGVPTIKDISVIEKGIDEKELLCKVFAVESSCSHPLAKSFMKEVSVRNLSADDYFVIETENIVGKGISGTVLGSDGLSEKLIIGNKKLFSDFNIDVSPFERQNEMCIFVGKVDDKAVLLGVFVIEDKIRKESRMLMKNLNEKGRKTILLTGDSRRPAEKTARETGIEDFIAEVLPDGKSSEIEKLQKDGHFVAMIGDGINDAPAMIQADVAVAMGDGSDIAAQSCDVILMNGNLMSIEKMLKISSMTLRKIKQNLFWAFFYNIIGISFAAGVFYKPLGILLNPMIASFAMSLSSLFVVTNALFLLKKKL